MDPGAPSEIIYRKEFNYSRQMPRINKGSSCELNFGLNKGIINFLREDLAWRHI